MNPTRNPSWPRFRHLIVLLVGTGLLGCVPPDPVEVSGNGGSVGGGSGGSTGTGGSSGGSGSGGAGAGGLPGSGGAITSGGAPGSGGAPNVGSGGSDASGGADGTGGASSGGRNGGGSSGGRSGGATGGSTGSGGTPGSGGVSGGGTGGAAGSAPLFSFFVTSIESMRALSGSQNGFGGDLRFGEATGLVGADKICRETAKRGMPGAENKTWRAFLSAFGPPAVHAIDRIGAGPWYDRMGRLVSMTKAGLAMTRPQGANAAIINDLPNENGIPNRQGVDNHDTLTGSNSSGMLQGNSAGGTCNDWTSSVGSTGRPMLGHAWPANSGMSWIQAHSAAGCAASVNLVQSGGAPSGSTGVGSGGGYGAIYCFALTP